MADALRRILNSSIEHEVDPTCYISIESTESLTDLFCQVLNDDIR